MRWSEKRKVGTVEAQKPTELANTLIAVTNPSVMATASGAIPVAGAGMLAPGTRLDQYLIEREIGSGGMGVVYEARDGLLDRGVALKVLPPQLCQYPEYVRRFAREAQIQARIDSPHVVTVHGLMEREVGLVLVMEHLQGETLAERLRRAGPLSVKEAVEIFEQACLGAEHIHRAGVIHQDLKPANIFITASGHVKLLDFGVARLLDEQRLALGGTMMGTLLYMSPEQIKGREVDFRSDVYTIGISLFEAVTGRLPFERKTHYALMHAHVQENPPPPRRYQAEIPAELEKVMLKAIAKEPARRFQTVTELRRALLRHRPKWLGERRRRRSPLKPTADLLARRVSPAYALTSVRKEVTIKRMLLGTLALDVLLLAGIIALIALAPISGYRFTHTPQATSVLMAPATKH
jgi:serine/threonine protein kinase